MNLPDKCNGTRHFPGAKKDSSTCVVSILVHTNQYNTTNPVGPNRIGPGGRETRERERGEIKRRLGRSV